VARNKAAGADGTAGAVGEPDAVALAQAGVVMDIAGSGCPEPGWIVSQVTEPAKFWLARELLGEVLESTGLLVLDAPEDAGGATEKLVNALAAATVAHDMLTRAVFELGLVHESDLPAPMEAPAEG